MRINQARTVVGYMKRTLTETQLYTLLESMKLINSTLDLDELLAIIMQEITINLKADRGTLYIVDETSREIWSKIAQGDKQLEIRQAIGKGISGYVAKTGESINIPDAYKDPRFNPGFNSLFYSLVNFLIFSRFLSTPA